MMKKTVLNIFIMLSMLVTLNACYSGDDPTKEKNAQSEETATAEKNGQGQKDNLKSMIDQEKRSK